MTNLIKSLAVPAAWVDAKLASPSLGVVVAGWDAEYRCPRCHQVPRSLLADCADPICAAEAFRAELALESMIEASDD